MWLQLRMLLQLRQRLRQEHHQHLPPHRLQRLRQHQCVRPFRQPLRQRQLPRDLPRLRLRQQRPGLRHRAARPLREQPPDNRPPTGRCVQQRLLQLPRQARQLRQGPQVPRRQDNLVDSRRVLVRVSAKVGRALRKGCAPRPRQVSPDRAAHRDLVARRHQDFRSGPAPGVPVRRLLEVSVPAQRAFQVCPRRSQESPYTSENHPPHADAPRSKNAMPKASAGCTRFERAPVSEQDARLMLNLRPLCNASRETLRLRKVSPSASLPRRWIFARRTY